MITGRWGKPTEVLLDLAVGEGGVVEGIINPGRHHIPIRNGRFDASSGEISLEGEYARPDSPPVGVSITGRLDGRMLRLAYRFGDREGAVDTVRIEEYRPSPLTIRDLLRPGMARVVRWYAGLFRPTGKGNGKRLRARGEWVESIIFRDAVTADIPALAELHVTTWNATYRTTRGPTVATRAQQWTALFAKAPRRNFVLVLEDQSGRLVGFTLGVPEEGEFEGQLSKIYLRWEYHGLGLGRRMMIESARRFLERGIHSFILFAELSNPTLGFYDRLGGERLLDERGRFHGAFGWRDVSVLLG